MYYPFVVVGAGITGLTIAERLTALTDSSVLLIEKRPYVGGNLYDKYNDCGILVHQYGPHIVHTNDNEVWRYLSNFTQWHKVEIKVKALINGKYVSIPINIKTIQDLYGVKFTPQQMRHYFDGFRSLNADNSAEDYLISRIGRDLYEKIYKNYILKQWETETKYIDTSVVKRLPIRFSDDDRYFDDRFQAVPKYGYHKMFQRMLNNKRILLLLNTKYSEVANVLHYDHLYFTGPLDQYFDYRYGILQYRGIIFKSETFSRDAIFPCPVTVYPNNYDYTRITEYKKITGQKHHLTTIVKEFPAWNKEYFYPVLTYENIQKADLYKKEKCPDNVTLVGRLAEYKYYNIDDAVRRALKVVQDTLTKNM